MLRWWRSVRGIWTATQPDSEELRDAFDREGATQNLRTFRALSPALALFHAFSLALFFRMPAPTAAYAEWLRWLVALHGALLVMNLGVSIACFRAKGQRTGLLVGEIVAAGYVIGTALTSANAQRLLPNQNAFALGLLATAVITRARPRVYVPAAIAGGAIVTAAVLHFMEDPALRRAHVSSALLMAGLGIVAKYAVRGIRLSELRARRETERLNAELESRVAKQVEQITRGARESERLAAEVTEHAKEIELLNDQLNQKVRERSRELSMALARLSADHVRLGSGTVLGDRVEIERLIGAGGMGAVYRGRDLLTGKTVAIKVVQAGTLHELDGLYRFFREAQALASLTHPAIVRSFHVDVADDGRLFQIMELVSGETLQALLDREGPLAAPVAARLGAVLADALASAHEAGIVHRDIKPANVMLTSASPGIKLLDFGVSKIRDARDAHGRTERAVIGTPEYLSPEQISDPEHVGDRADVYALGLVVYLAITGRPAYDSVSSESWLLAHVAREPDDITSIVPDLDPEIARVVMVCLRKAPEERPAAAEIARTLGVCADRLECPSLEETWSRLSAPPPHLPPPEPPTTGVPRAEITGRRTLKVVR